MLHVVMKSAGTPVGETSERRWLNFSKHKELVAEENILVDKFDVEE